MTAVIFLLINDFWGAMPMAHSLAFLPQAAALQILNFLPCETLKAYCLSFFAALAILRLAF